MLFTKTPSTDLQENSEPIFCNSSFVFNSAEQAAKNFNENNSKTFIYSRFSNPNTSIFADRVAALEGGQYALTTASGMSAILSLIMGVCEAGDRILCAGNVFGSTVQLLSKQLMKFNITTDFIFENSSAAWQAKLNEYDDIKLVFLETPSNPMQTVIDIAAIASMVHERNIILAVDNCFCPYLQKPLEFGADIVVGSGTKYIDGQGRMLSGYIVGSRAIVEDKIFPFIRCSGVALSPFNAWIMHKSIETLPLRIEKHSQSAHAIAQWLEGLDGVSAVYYTGLNSHPNHQLAMKQQSSMGGGVLTFVINGDKQQAFRFIDSLKLFTITANFGDNRSLVTHPATTTHLRVPEDDRKKIGLSDSVIRLSIGLEPVELLQQDIEQSLNTVFF